jgi:hypothetical protein
MAAEEGFLIVDNGMEFCIKNERKHEMTTIQFCANFKNKKVRKPIPEEGTPIVKNN